MKVVILAGGYGTRISEESATAPEADGRDRRAAHPVAHHEDVLGARLRRVRDLLRLPAAT